MTTPTAERPRGKNRRKNRTAEPAGAPKTFDEFFAGLQGDVEAVELDRRRTLRRMIKVGLVWLAIGSTLVYACLAFRIKGDLAQGVIVVTLMGIPGHAWLIYRPYCEAFKARIVGPLVRAYDPSFAFEAADHVPRRAFEETRMFRDLKCTDFEGEDRVQGRIGETKFDFSEVHAENVVTRGSGRNRKTTRKTIFKGVFFHADFNKHFEGETYLLPDRAQRALGALGQSLQGMSDTYGELVKLEDPEFEKYFAVYSTCQVEARYILSSALMARIADFRRKSRHRVRVAFVGSKVYVAIHVKKDLFEPRIFRTVKDPKVYREFWDDLALFTDIVEDLNLNTRIWTKR